MSMSKQLAFVKQNKKNNRFKQYVDILYRPTEGVG